MVLSFKTANFLYGIYFINISKINVSEIHIQDPVTLKQKVNIGIKEIPADYLTTINTTSTANVVNISSFINEKEALDAANIYCGDLYKIATSIKIQENLLTDDNFSIGAIDKNAVASDPILKKANKLSDIPVWLISYEGLKLERRIATFTEQVVVVDAVDGKVLYSFRYR